MNGNAWLSFGSLHLPKGVTWMWSRVHERAGGAQEAFQ